MMPATVIFMSLALSILLPANLAAEQHLTEDRLNTTSFRQEKFLSLFSVVRFPNSMCTGTNAYNGTCLTSAECSALKGTPAGTCASGFGVCCTILIQSCGATTNRNCTYWQNSGYPTGITTPGECAITVQKCATNICQLRLDFSAFSIAQPLMGSCTTDLFTVSGQSNLVPTICGNNAGQHMYLDMSSGSATWQLRFIFTDSATTRSWNIKLSQIPCDSTLIAPDRCLQYFTAASGTITSFNYASVTAITANSPILQLNNQDYTVCIRTGQGFCGICYSVCSPTSFSVTGDATMTAVGAVDASCMVPDFLLIPCATDTMNSVLPCSNRICGTAFSAVDKAAASIPVYSYRQPFELRFYTDNTEAGAMPDVANQGFCLNYVQQACTTTNG